MNSLKNGSDYYVRGEEPSEEMNNSYLRVFENIPVGIAVVDCEGNCHYVNSRLCRMLDRSEQELLGTGF
ncbi:PAS domain-containing protein [Methanosarcina hadiensis]|uniref:PAS domain-containing protein n=1 Tax=Methanosarcina hadiensis TaxID=3078083 RepID=UPI003977BBAA